MKQISQNRLRSALNVAKENPVPIQKLPMAKSKGSALKMSPMTQPKSRWTAATNFKG